MAQTTYSYSKLVNPDRLAQEIHNSTSITIALASISTVGEMVYITMRDALPSEQETALATLVSNHVNTPLPGQEIIQAEIVEDPILKTTDKRYIVKPNVRPIGTTGYFTARDDDTSNPEDVGSGNNYIKLNHEIGDPLEVTITQRFNVEGNRSWIHEGYMTHHGAQFDRFCFYISTVPTPFTEASNTNFMKMDDYGIIVPAAGNGNVTIDTENLTTLVSVVPKTDTGLCSTAYWNATFNSTTGKYENLTPAPTGNGKYNIFFTEVVLKRYINSICLIGDNHPLFATSDPSELASNLKCNYRFTTTAPDHAWQASVFISMFREKGT